MIHLGDCIEVMRGMPADSVDAICTDPPYGLEFMGKEWDRFDRTGPASFEHSMQPGWGHGTTPLPRHGTMGRQAVLRFQAWCTEWGTEALRVTKPGGYLLAFGGTRTHHRLVCGLEDAGWIIRDELDWIYACLSDDTEILTGRGWLHYNEVSTNDTALAFDSATGQLQWEPIEAVHKYHHEGDMVRLVGDGTDQLVTLNHRLVLVDGPGVAQVPGVRQRVLAALRSFAPIQRSRMLDSMQRDTPLARSSVPNREAVGVDRGRQGVVSTEDERPQEPGMEGRRYRFPQAWELFGSPLHPSAWLELADGSQGRVHHGAPATDGGSVRLPDDQGRGGQSREPRPDRQSARELDAVALEPGSQAVRVVEAGDSWSLVPSGPVWASEVDYAGVVWCVTVPSGAFVARRGGLAFVTGNSGFPKGKANLKPAHEPIVLARKPGPLQALNIEETRIGTAGDKIEGGTKGTTPIHGGGITNRSSVDQSTGRWPSNVLLSDPELFDQPNPWVVGSGATSVTNAGTMRNDSAIGGYHGTPSRPAGTTLSGGDAGGYSRFFLVPKSSRADREPVLRGQLPELPGGYANESGRRLPDRSDRPQHDRPMRANTHPTTKPTDLMRHLVRLVTPPGGTVLDCFLGSGTTAIACELEGFPWIGIEQSAEYVAIAEARLNGTQRGLGLDVPAPTKRRNTMLDGMEAKRATGGRHAVNNPEARSLKSGYQQGWHGVPDEEPAA